MHTHTQDHHFMFEDTSRVDSVTLRLTTFVTPTLLILSYGYHSIEKCLLYHSTVFNVEPSSKSFEIMPQDLQRSSPSPRGLQISGIIFLNISIDSRMCLLFKLV